MGRKLFCEINPVCFQISEKKEILKRGIQDLYSKDLIARKYEFNKLAETVKSHSSIIVRRLYGVDIKLQENKATNLELACGRISGILIKPGEIFSFWELVGNPTARKGYKPGLNIRKGKPVSGIGGGLCQLANMIHYLVLHSSMEITEIHHHSDALFPDERRRVPFGTGTSICYNYKDYRFKNNTDQNVQILVWCENGELHGELRSTEQFPFSYELVEENAHFHKEGTKYYRISKVFRIITDKISGDTTGKELILSNHSEVLYDYSMIPIEEIR